jgi:hypothetical protein
VTCFSRSWLHDQQTIFLQHPFCALSLRMQPQPSLSSALPDPISDDCGFPVVTLGVTLDSAAAVTLANRESRSTEPASPPAKCCASHLEGHKVEEVEDLPFFTAQGNNRACDEGRHASESHDVGLVRLA